MIFIKEKLGAIIKQEYELINDYMKNMTNETNSPDLIIDTFREHARYGEYSLSFEYDDNNNKVISIKSEKIKIYRMAILTLLTNVFKFVDDELFRQVVRFVILHEFKHWQLHLSDKDTFINKTFDELKKLMVTNVDIEDICNKFACKQCQGMAENKLGVLIAEFVLLRMKMKRTTDENDRYKILKKEIFDLQQIKMNELNI